MISRQLLCDRNPRHTCELTPGIVRPIQRNYPHWKLPRTRRGRSLRKADLDTPVLRLAHALRSWHPRVVLAAAGARHVAARDAQIRQGVRESVGTSLRKPL